MIGVLVVTHGYLSKEFLNTVELIMGKQKNCSSLSLLAGDSIEEFSSQIFSKIKELDEGEGVIVVTDLFLASPYNQTTLKHREILKAKINYRLLTGVNLPMLLELFNQRMLGGSSLDGICDAAMTSAKNGIKEFTKELSKNRKQEKK